MSCLEVIEHLSYEDRQFQYLKGTCRKDGGGALHWGGWAQGKEGWL